MFKLKEIITVLLLSFLTVSCSVQHEFDRCLSSEDVEYIKVIYEELTRNKISHAKPSANMICYSSRSWLEFDKVITSIRSTYPNEDAIYIIREKNEDKDNSFLTIFDKFAIIVAALTLIFSTIIHFIFRGVQGYSKYRGITLAESVIIVFGSVPGIAGCAVGWAGFAFPLPLIIGLPLDLITTGSNCAWGQLLFIDEELIGGKYLSTQLAWVVVNVMLISVLYYRRHNNKYTNTTQNQ